MMRFCDCGCKHCDAQTQTHKPCQFECEPEETPRRVARGRDITIIGHREQ